LQTDETSEDRIKIDDAKLGDEYVGYSSPYTVIGKAGKSGKAWSGGGNSFDAEHLGDDGKR
jgi:hypothetical protein